MEDETEQADLAAEAVLVAQAADIRECREDVAVGSESLHGGEGGSVLGIAGVAEEELEAGLRQQGEVVVLEAAGGIGGVEAAGDGQGGIEVFVQPPGEVVAVEAVVLKAQRGELVGIVAEAVGANNEFVEEAPVALARVNAEGAAEQAQAVAEVDVAAVFAEVAINGAEAVAGFEGVDDVVAAGVAAQRRAGGFRRRGGGGLGGGAGGQEQGSKYGSSHGRPQRRKSGSALEPWMRTWQSVQVW